MLLIQLMFLTLNQQFVFGTLLTITEVSITEDQKRYIAQEKGLALKERRQNIIKKFKKISILNNPTAIKKISSRTHEYNVYAQLHEMPHLKLHRDFYFNYTIISKCFEDYVEKRFGFKWKFFILNYNTLIYKTQEKYAIFLNQSHDLKKKLEKSFFQRHPPLTQLEEERNTLESLFLELQDLYLLWRHGKKIADELEKTKTHLNQQNELVYLIALEVVYLKTILTKFETIINKSIIENKIEQIDYFLTMLKKIQSFTNKDLVENPSLHELQKSNSQLIVESYTYCEKSFSKSIQNFIKQIRHPKDKKKLIHLLHLNGSYLIKDLQMVINQLLDLKPYDQEKFTALEIFLQSLNQKVSETEETNKLIESLSLKLNDQFQKNEPCLTKTQKRKLFLSKINFFFTRYLNKKL
jgi:hypothetical protein